MGYVLPLKVRKHFQIHQLHFVHMMILKMYK